MNETAGKVAARGVYFYRKIWIEEACQHGCYSVLHTTTAVTRSTASRWNAGYVTKYSYNSLGLRSSTTDALNHTWLFDYDNLGRLTGQTDPLGHAVVYTVDGLGRTTALHQNGRSEQWAFRADGVLATYTDFAGRVTSFAYDNDQLLTGIDYPDGMADVSYGYDAAGNITSMSDGLGSTSYGYDVLNRLDTRTRNNRTVDYGYSAANQVTSIDYWGQGTVSYGYDNAGRLDHLTPWGGAATTYSYRSSGLLAGISRPNSVATTYSYDTASRLTGLTHVQGGSNTLNAIVYGLDANGNRVSLTDVDGLTTYVYDALNRLDVATYPAIPGGPPAATIDYSIDDVGNRTSDGATTYTYDASDRITNSGFVYDDNGNLLSDGVKSYQYDAANRLTKVISGSVTIDYGYDGWGNLILESSNGITTEYVLDERGALPTMLGEVRSDGTTRLYAYGPEGFAAQMTVGGGIEYPLLDGLGSIRHLTDGSGTVTLSRSYDAFGNVRYTSGTGVTHFGYTGELQDQPTGLVYLRARFYHPVLGRFLQRDSFGGSIARGQSFNRYSYTENNPVNLTDPSGNCPWCIAAGFGAAAGAAFEYGGQVFQNYRDGQSGSDMFRPRDWGKIGQAAVAGGVGGLTGFYLGPAAAGLMRFGSPLLNSMAAGALEGAGSGVLSQIATNLLRGCAWSYNLIKGGLHGALGGAFGGVLGHLAKPIAQKAKQKLGDLADEVIQAYAERNRSLSEVTRLRTSIIRFAQGKYSTSGKLDDGTRYSVAKNVAELQADPNFDLPPIAVFIKEEFMNSWGPMKNKKGHEGDPINLMDGLIYTLNHRRFVAYIEAQRETIPIRWAELEEIYENRFEFDTPDWGTFIEPRDR